MNQPSQRSGWSSVHPFPVMGFYMGTAILVMLWFHPVYSSISLLALVALHIAQDGGRRLKRNAWWIVILCCLVIFINPLITQRGTTILMYIAERPMTLEAIAYGVMTALFLANLLILFLAYQMTITPLKFMYIFARWMPRSALVMLMSLRFIPLLKRRLDQLMLVQQTNGVDPREGPWRKRAADAMRLLRLLVASSLEEALVTADAMKARGYGTGRRTSFAVYRWDRRDRWVLGLMLVSFILLVAGYQRGYGMIEVYPQLTYPPFDLMEMGTLIIYTMYMMIPAAIQGRENWRWRTQPKPNQKIADQVKAALR